jgi:hypothetical protein
MKSKRFLLAGMAALTLALAPAAYADPSGGGIAVDDLAKLQTILTVQPSNTADTPYTVVLPAFTLSRTDTANSDWGKVNTAVKEASRFVILDLGKCAFTGNIVTGSGNGSRGMNIIRSNAYIKGIILPKGLTSIGERAFDGCTVLSSVSIPASVTSIDGHAFYNCSSLNSVSIPASVTYIGFGAFDGCTALTSVTFECVNIADTSFGNDVFPGGDILKTAYLAGGAGTYTRTAARTGRSGLMTKGLF